MKLPTLKKIFAAALAFIAVLILAESKNGPHTLDQKTKDKK